MLPTQLKPRSKHRQFLLLGVLILTLGQIPFNAWAATVYYVKPNISTNNAGDTWATATNLQDALKNKASSGDQIWVAGGTYTPGAARTDTFTLIDGVEIYGGFQGVPGTEGEKTGKVKTFVPSHSDDSKVRNISDYQTTLSGDLNNDDNSNIIPSETTRSDNSYHVVTVGSGIDATLDGLTIQDGNANGTTGTDKENGGGIYNDGGSPKLVKVTFSSNTASNNGGGLYNNGCSDLTISGGSFTGNTATNDGGGLYNLNCSPEVSSSTTTVTFSKNIATNNGGGMYNKSSSPYVSRVFFKENSAIDGAGIYNSIDTSGTNVPSDPSIHHAIFDSNNASGNGGGIYSNGTGSDTGIPTPIISQTTFYNNTGGAMYNNNSKWEIHNSILWDNSTEISDNSSTTTVQYSIVKGGWSTGSNILGADLGNDDPKFQNAANSDFLLGVGSPAIDAGLDSLVPTMNSGDTKDLNKDDRIVNVSGNTIDTVDMGPYEAQFPAVSKILCKTPDNCGDTTTPSNEPSFTFEVIFNEDVSGVNIEADPPDPLNPSDFALTKPDSLEATITNFSQVDSKTYTVTVEITSGEGTLRLDVVDDDSIVNAYNIPLGNAGADNGNTSLTKEKADTFEIYTFDTLPPTVTIDQASTQTDPTTNPIINFLVTFSEPVNGFDENDVTVRNNTGDATFGTIDKVVTQPDPTNKPNIYNVAISGMITSGKVAIDIPKDVATDAAGNNNVAFDTSTVPATNDNEVTYNNFPVVDSITRDDATPTNASSVNYTVTFSQDVSGVDKTDFDIAMTGLTDATITSITPDANTASSTFTVTVDTGNGNGTLQLNLVDNNSIINGDNVQLESVNDLDGSFDGEIYTIEKTAPTVEITEVTPDPRATSVDSITIVFSEAVIDFTVDDIELNASSLSSSGATLTTSDNITWTLSGLTSLTDNDGDYELTVTAAGITDNAGNVVVADGSETWAKVTNPIIVNNAVLTLPQGTSATITNAMLQVSDSEQEAADLTFTIGTTVPANGTLKLNGTALSNGDTFTQEDIDNNKVTYEHDNSSNLSDSFTFTVSDGAGGSITETTFSITITTTPNTSPSLDTNTGLTLDQGSNPTITNTLLQVSDSEQEAADLTFTISTVPANGTLKLNNTALDTTTNKTFTQDDIDKDKLTYEHNNSSTTSDSFTFTVTDGAGGTVALTTFDITINAVSNTTLPNSPTDLTATAVSQTQIDLSWIDKSDDELGFKIKREGTLIETTVSDIESYSDTGLTCNTTYTYQVTAYNDNDESTAIEDSATTHACDEEEEDNSSSGGGTTPLPTKLNLTVQFAGKGSGSIESEPSGIDCDSSDENCSYAFSAATDVTLTPTAAEGSEFSSWSGAPDCGDGQVQMDGSISCTVYFQLLPSTLTVTYEGNGTVSSSPSGINCGDACTNTFDGGSEVTLTAAPDDGWTLDNWTGDCNSNGQVTIDSGKKCHAIFVEEGSQETEVSLTPPYLKVTKTGEGTITSEPAGIDCGEDCTQEYTAPGTKVTLTATPDEGWAFDQWEGDCDDDGQITITDQGDQCEAIFVQTTVPFVLNVAITGQGSVTSDPTGIDCGDTCNYDYQSGLEIVLTATPDNAWEFEGWRGHCDETGQVVLDGEFNFKQCRAVFVESTIVAEAGLESKSLALEIIGNGTVTSQPSGIDCKSESKIYLGDCTEDYTNDTEVTLTPTPDTDWRFEGWAGDCDSDGSVFVDTEKLCEAIFVDANAEPFTLNVAITGEGSVTSEPTGIDCGATCSKDYATGLEVALNATPDNGWEFEGWRGHCDEAGYVTLDGEFNFKQCRAVFVESSKASALDSNPDSESDALASESESKALALEITGFGTVTSQPTGIDCKSESKIYLGDCTEDYTNDIEVTLTPTPDTDWRFEGWAGDCDSEGYVFVDTEKQCEAIFVDANAEPFTLNIAITGDGAVTSEPTGIDCGTTCSKDYATGLEVALNATPDDGWEFEGWRGHCDETGKVVLDGEFNFKQCRAVFVESTKIEIEEESEESNDSDDTETNSDSSSDNNAETSSDSSSNDNAETSSNSSSDSETGSNSDDDSGTNSDSSTNDSETASGSSTNTNDNSQIGTSSANIATENNQTGATSSFENVGPNGGDGNNDGTLDSQQNNVLSLQNANGEYVTVEEKNGCTINLNGNNLEFDCSQADVDNYYYGVSDPNEVPQCQESQVTCQVITIQGQLVVVASTTLNDGDVNDSVAGDSKITQSLAPGQSVVQETNVSRQSASGNSTASGNSAISSGNASSTTSPIEVFENNLQSIDIVIEVGETVNLTMGGIDGIFFIKEMPDLALIAVDEEGFVSSNGELILTGLAVGNTQMILSDQLSSQEVTLYITVLPPVTLEQQITASKDIGLKTRLTTLKVGQIVTLMIADGQGMLSITGQPDEELISLSDWVAYGDGTAEVTLKGIQAGSTQLVVKDSATPPQQTTLNIIVIGNPAIGSQATTEPGSAVNDAVNDLETPTTGSTTAETLASEAETKPTIEISLDDSPCEQLNSLGIDEQGNPFESNACFTGRVSLNGILQSNVRQLTHREAQIIRVSSRIQVAPEHVAQPAEILLVGVYSPSEGETTFYTRDEQTWFMWDEQISRLIIAQEHPVLPEIVDVFIFEGDLSILPGEFTVYVGYRLLENGTIIFNGLEPIHFFVGNR